MGVHRVKAEDAGPSLTKVLAAAEALRGYLGNGAGHHLFEGLGGFVSRCCRLRVRASGLSGLHVVAEDVTTSRAY